MRALSSVFPSAALAALLSFCAFAQTDVAASLYALDMRLTDQSGAARQLDLYRGHVTLVTMFYASCPAACPLLIDGLRTIESALSPEERERVRVLMVSIDPQRDSPQALQAQVKQRRINVDRWTLARTDESSVRLLAAALDIQYRRLPDGEYNHTSVITLVDRDGHALRQTSVLGRTDADFVAAVRASLRQPQAAR